MTEFSKGDVLRIGGSLYEVEAIDHKQWGTAFRLRRNNDGVLLHETKARLESDASGDGKYTLIEVTGVTEDEVEVVD